MIEELFERLKQNTINLNDYSGSLLDAAFDIVTAETAIAGIADQLLAGMTPSYDQELVLDKKLLDGSVWQLIDGGTCELEFEEALLSHAKMVISLQMKCKEYLHGKRT